MPEIPSYPFLASVASNDTFIVLDVNDTSGSSQGTVKQVTGANAATSFASLADTAVPAQVFQRMTAS